MISLWATGSWDIFEEKGSVDKVWWGGNSGSNWVEGLQHYLLSLCFTLNLIQTAPWNSGISAIIHWPGPLGRTDKKIQNFKKSLEPCSRSHISRLMRKYDQNSPAEYKISVRIWCHSNGEVFLPHWHCKPSRVINSVLTGHCFQVIKSSLKWSNNIVKTQRFLIFFGGRGSNWFDVDKRNWQDFRAHITPKKWKRLLL